MGLTPFVYLVLASLGYTRRISRENLIGCNFLVLIFFIFYSLRLLQGIDEQIFAGK